ncbi:unnamed protein product [Prorocentrum cordatum]|uniref:Uncharacterized protein n=1 Tax=Prorocentrum cordatum TaxID=2364126 RepID=A0ABN9X535_9DINO|nr:unnamed protein product [Polarella glacialis]
MMRVECAISGSAPQRCSRSAVYRVVWVFCELFSDGIFGELRAFLWVLHGSVAGVSGCVECACGFDGCTLEFVARPRRWPACLPGARRGRGGLSARAGRAARRCDPAADVEGHDGN